MLIRVGVDVWVGLNRRFILMDYMMQGVCWQRKVRRSKTSRSQSPLQRRHPHRDGWDVDANVCFL